MGCIYESGRVLRPTVVIQRLAEVLSRLAIDPDTIGLQDALSLHTANFAENAHAVTLFDFHLGNAVLIAEIYGDGLAVFQTQAGDGVIVLATGQIKASTVPLTRIWRSC